MKVIIVNISNFLIFNLFRPRPRRTEKPWYDVSDEEVDMVIPDHITSIISVRGSSDDDVF